jgi:hypothetical protein
VVDELPARLEAQRWNWQLLSDEILGGLVAGGSGREARVPEVQVEKGVREARLGAKIGVRICQQEPLIVESDSEPRQGARGDPLPGGDRSPVVPDWLREERPGGQVISAPP